MKFLLALFLGAHGIAHMVGFVASWRLASLPDVPYKTTLLADSIDVGDGGVRLVGVLWLLAAVAFVVAASGVAVDAAGRFGRPRLQCSLRWGCASSGGPRRASACT